MCGILGHYAKSFSDQTEKIFNQSLSSLNHRGPDSRGIKQYHLHEGILTFGHTRLSIIDLTDGGHQPMISASGRYTIIYNGEIYNYRELREILKSEGVIFKSDSDTEVLLAAWEKWGRNALEHFKGMFSFAVFDRVRNSVTLVRDAFGIKPLFYYLGQKSLVFGSEIQAVKDLLPQKAEVNLNTAYDYLFFGQYDYGHDTFYEEINHLPPGHVYEIVLNGLQNNEPERWCWPSIEERKDLTFEEASDEFRQRFLDNVRLHLRSDVPLGAALSGGIDSSSLVCAMRYLEPDMPIHTFSYIAKGSNVDEEPWVDIINNTIKAESHKVFVSPDDLMKDLDDMIMTQGEPFASTSIYAQYRVFQQARKEGIIVTLDGQGADELLGGYMGYPHGRLRTLFGSARWGRALQFLNSWSEQNQIDKKMAIYPWLASCLPIQIKSMLKSRLVQSHKYDWVESGMFYREFLKNGFYEQQKHFEIEKGRSLNSMLRLELSGKTGLVPLLRHEDRNAMRWSVESRVPFLTTDLAEFVLSLPESYLVSDQGVTKHLLRESMRNIVPDSVLNRRDKIGFETPEWEWMNDVKPYIFNCLEGLVDFPGIKYDKFEKYVTKVLNHDMPYNKKIWRLMNLGRWIQLNF